MKDINIINESSAITMYYGYTKYRDMFVSEKTKVDKNMIKHVIFIDSGYSKTTFTYSSFSYLNFKIHLVKSYYNLGGRNIDEILFDYCKEAFMKEQTMSKNDRESFMNIKNKVRLLQAIDKARKALSINDDTVITVDSFFDENDLSNPIKKEDYERIIYSFIKDYEFNLKNFKNEIEKMNNNKLPNNLSIEMAGELIRTPILQDKIKNIFNIPVSKTILVDECISVGCSLIGYYINNKLPINTFGKMYFYNYYDILLDVKQGKDNNIIFKKNGLDDGESFIYKKKIKEILSRTNIDFIFKYKDEDVKNLCENKELYHFKVNTAELKKNNLNWEKCENIIFDIKLSYSDEIIFKIFLEKNNEKIECNINNCITIDDSYINSEKTKKESIKEILSKHKEFDELYLNFTEKRNELIKTINMLKETNNTNELINFENEIKMLDSLDFKKKAQKFTEIEKKFMEYLSKDPQNSFRLFK